MIAKQLLWLCCLCALLTPTWGSKCFFPNGTAVTSNTVAPCISIKGETSMCCRTNGTNPDTCESNGLCGLARSKSYFRSSCTDSTWKHPNCLRNICMDDTAGGNSTNNAQVQLCRVGEQLKWCCGRSDSCCTNDKMFTLKDPWINIGGDSSTASADDSGTSSTEKLAIGLGVGISLGVLAIVTLGLGFWWGRKKAPAKLGALQNDHQRAAGPATDIHADSRPVFETEANSTKLSELPSGRE